MNRPLISVIVPCFKVENYLSRCIDSILNQTYGFLEVILVDDGSPDRCGEICDTYAKRDSRIRVIHKKNGGLSDARNVAIDIARGDYISFIDSDDYVTSDYVETLLSLCEKYNTKMSVADWHIFSMSENPIIVEKKVKEIFFKRNDALEDMFNQVHFDVSACSKLFHRSLFVDIRFPVGILFEDLLTTFKLILKCNDGVAFSSKQIYYYMFRPDSIEGSVFSKTKMDSAIEVFNVMKTYENELKNVSGALRSKLISFCFHLVLKMPDNYQNGVVLYDYIRRNRWDVLINNKARIKTRLGCLSSYLGIPIMKKLFSFVDRRS